MRDISIKKSICIFDLDGTLTDSYCGIANGWKYALEPFGISVDPENIKPFLGPPLRQIIKEVYNFSDEDMEKTVDRYREYYSAKGMFENEVYSGITEALEFLRGKGILLGVATNKTKGYAEKILEYFKIDGYFTYISGDKPDGSLTKDGTKREIIKIAMNAIDPTLQMSAVMVGDRKQDIIGAREAGIDSIGVTWGYGTHDELREAGATWIVDSTEELCRLF